MTEQDTPQKEYGIWTQYFLKRLEEAGIPVTESANASLKNKHLPTFASISYDVGSPNYCLDAYIEINADRMATEDNLDNAIEEALCLATKGNLYIKFQFKNGVAKADVVNWGDQADSKVNFVDGAEYHPKLAIDALITIFLQDYHTQKPNK